MTDTVTTEAGKARLDSLWSEIYRTRLLPPDDVRRYRRTCFEHSEFKKKATQSADGGQ